MKKDSRPLYAKPGNDLEEERKSLATLVNVGVDGILLAVSNNTLDEEHLAHLHEENIPFVFFDKVPESISGPKVLTNDYKGAFMATEHLIKQKYTRIAHIKGQQGSRNALPRFMGYTDALAKHRHVFNAAYVKQCKHASEEEGYKFTNDLLRMKQRPDAFFTVNDETAIGVITALRKHKISIPDEVGVVGYCNSKTGMYMQPSLTSVEQYGNDIGSRSAEILADMIMGKAGEDVMSKQIILEPRLVIRDSSKRH
ncbi:MAG: substrate-binding domain-containing protein [Chitinophagaceae bacterium]